MDARALIEDLVQKIAPNTTATRRWGLARARLAATLKRCADDVDARIPDGRG